MKFYMCLLVLSVSCGANDNDDDRRDQRTIDRAECTTEALTFMSDRNVTGYTEIEMSRIAEHVYEQCMLNRGYDVE